MANRKKTPMERLTKGYEEFIKGKQTKKSGKPTFDKAIKKAVKPKGRASK